MAGPLTQASPEDSLPVAKRPQDVKGRFRKGPKKGLAGMVGKDLSWSKRCGTMKVRGWKTKGSRGCGLGRGRSAPGKRGAPTERPTDSASLLAPGGLKTLLQPCGQLLTLWGVGGAQKRLPDLGAPVVPGAAPEDKQSPPSTGTGRVVTECACKSCQLQQSEAPTFRILRLRLPSRHRVPGPRQASVGRRQRLTMRSSGKAPMLQRSPASPAASFSMAWALPGVRRPGTPTASPAQLGLRAHHLLLGRSGAPRLAAQLSLGSHVASLLPRGISPHPHPRPAPRPPGPHPRSAQVTGCSGWRWLGKREQVRWDSGRVGVRGFPLVPRPRGVRTQDCCVAHIRYSKLSGGDAQTGEEQRGQAALGV